MNLYDRIAPFYAVDMALNMPFDDVGFWSRACAARGTSVLELGCGSGRISAGLLAAGLQVCAVDRSAPMLAELRRQLPASPQLAVLRADLRALPLQALYDVVLAPYSLCTYWLDEADWEAALGGARACLRPGGWLLIDAFVPRPLFADDDFREDYRRPWDGGWLQRLQRRTPLGDGRNRIERRYRLLDAHGGLREQIDTVDLLRPLTPEQLVEHLDRAGFEAVESVDDYADPRASAPRRFVAVLARRR
jgi:SAM-dependent methyltransferase